MTRPTSALEDIDFAELLRKRLGGPLEDLRIDYSWVLEWVAENFQPDDIFPDDVLKKKEGRL